MTNLTEVERPFDLLADNGCLHSLFTSAAREGYMQTVLHLTRSGSRLFLRCFVRDPRWPPFRQPGEVEGRFGGEFDIEELEPLPSGLAIDAVYLMRRKEG